MLVSIDDLLEAPAGPPWLAALHILLQIDKAISCQMFRPSLVVLFLLQGARVLVVSILSPFALFSVFEFLKCGGFRQQKISFRFGPFWPLSDTSLLAGVMECFERYAKL